MHVRRILIALVCLAVLAACGGSPETPEAKDDKSTLPTISAGTVLPDALTEAHCVREASGDWRASGTVKNTTPARRDLDVRIHIGPADGKDGPAQVKLIRDVKPGKSVEWSVLRVVADNPAGPCQIQVAVAK
jgi:hypothetical protein